MAVPCVVSGTVFFAQGGQRLGQRLGGQAVSLIRSVGRSKTCVSRSIDTPGRFNLCISIYSYSIQPNPFSINQPHLA